MKNKGKYGNLNFFKVYLFFLSIYVKLVIFGIKITRIVETLVSEPLSHTQQPGAESGSFSPAPALAKKSGSGSTKLR